MSTKNYISRVIFLIVYTIYLYFIFDCLGHSIIKANSVDVFLFSSFIALAINILITSCFFETPKDVIASSINVLLLLSGLFIEKSISKSLLTILLIYALTCLILSVLSVILYNPEIETNNFRRNTSNLLKNITINIGNSQLMFSILILCLLINIYSNQEHIFYITIILLLTLIAYSKILNLFFSIISYLKSIFCKKCAYISKPIGHIVAVQAKDTFIVDLNDIKNRESLKLFDCVSFKYEPTGLYYRGIIIDRYYLNEIQKIKILKLSDSAKDKEENKNYTPNIVYKVEPNKKEKKLQKTLIGTVIENSNINVLNFEYIDKLKLSNGDLLKVNAKDKNNKSIEVLFQIIQAQTSIKTLEKGNQTGLIEAQAIQLGVWNSESRNFENYGWVFPINTPIYLAKDIKGTSAKEGETELGKIEDTDFNVIVNIDELITHHTAILGTTGTGKSVFARNLIKQIAKLNHKIFFIDFTGEATKFISRHNIIDTSTKFQIDTETKDVKTLIKEIVEKRGSNYGKNPKGFNELENTLCNFISTSINTFVQNTDEAIGIFELPELSNTEETLEYTKFFFKALFDIAKEGSFKDIKACIVLEEAHTLIPEWNSVGGTDDKTARRLTNTIAQIALQGRKYNIGLMVIAQRTANVSKTILTQCNTVISFKQFDNTSKDFLVNHFGSNIADILPTLKKRTAVIVGQALISDVPIIFKVPEIKEDIIV